MFVHPSTKRFLKFVLTYTKLNLPGYVTPLNLDLIICPERVLPSAYPRQKIGYGELFTICA